VIDETAIATVVVVQLGVQAFVVAVIVAYYGRIALHAVEVPERPMSAERTPE
jgi:hypothetical protein